MDIKQLKYFSKICENDSFTETAKELYITQQGLSKSMKSLEYELGLPLFYRNGNKIKLTRYGLCLKDRSAHVIEEFDLLKYSIEKMSNNNDNKVKIGYSLGTTNALSYDFISDFQGNHPNIELSITEYQDFICERAVDDEEIDVGFTIGPVDESKFDCKTIVLKKMCLIVNDRSNLSKNNEIDFRDIKDEKIIIRNKDFKIYHNFINMCRKAGFEPNIFFTTADFNLVNHLSSVSEAVGVGVPFKDMPELHFIPFKDVCCTWEVCLITKKGHYITNGEKCFIDYVLSSY